jgi:plasmid stabilization system protein ParE
MNRNIVVEPEAEAELAEAAVWYEEQQGGLGHEFMDEVDLALAKIQGNPDQYQVMRRRARRVLLRRFPYALIYRVLNNEVHVLACIHGHRHPRRWQSRT